MTNKSTKRELENFHDSANRLADKTDRVMSKVTELEESFEEYTARELEYIDKFKPMTENTMEDEDLYEIIIKYNFDNNKIKQELQEYMKLVKKKGDEYGWTKIENGKKIKPEKIPEIKVQPKKTSQPYKKNERYDRSYNQKTYNTNNESTQVAQDTPAESYYNEQSYSSRGRNAYRGKSYGGRGRSNNYYQNNNYYDYNYKYNNYKNDYDLFDHDLGFTYRVVDVNANDENKNMESVREDKVQNTQENVITSAVVSEPEATKETQVELQLNPVEEVKFTQHLKEVKANTTQVNKVHSPIVEDDSVIPSNITSNINNIIEDNETPLNLVKHEIVQNVTESSATKSTNLTNSTQTKSVYNQSVHNFQISSRKPNEELSMQSQSITLGNTSNATKPAIIPTSGTPFQINAQQTKKPVPTVQPTKNTQMQQRKPENTQVPSNMNPMMGSPEYYAQMQQGGYMPWPMVYFPQMQGMNYDPNSMGGVNPMYNPQNYYMQPNDMEDNYGKNKKTNFPPIQNPNMNDMNAQYANQSGFPPMNSFYYYNSLPPYGNMGMNPMMMGGYGMNMGNNQPDNTNYNQNFENMKNLKNSGNDDVNQNYFGHNFYKQP